jgi:hypothetical protein
VLIIGRTKFFSNIKVLFVSANYTTQPQPKYKFGNQPCIKIPSKKAADFKDCNHDRWGTAPRCCTDELDVLSVIHLTAEPWRRVTPTAIKNCSVKCGFLIMSAAMMTV